ncbi:uncharacterized protein V1516DRAFT_670908, partial [Lipomyces oligophaga]|uniref:uncharacterized protein n=1 Tax=Lipomyces oligophaga TaxID=45792 RepID=UPI0034CD62C8
MYSEPIKLSRSDIIICKLFLCYSAATVLATGNSIIVRNRNCGSVMCRDKRLLTGRTEPTYVCGLHRLSWTYYYDLICWLVLENKCPPAKCLWTSSFNLPKETF